MKKNKIKFIFNLIIVVLFLSSCSPVGLYFKYQPKYSNSKKISEKTKISVTINQINIPEHYFKNLSYDIKESIKSDLQKNIFPIIDNINPDLIVNVVVNDITFKNEPWGLIWFPLVYIGVPIAKNIGKASISLEILNDKGQIIKQYQANKEIIKWRGLYYGNKYLLGGKECLVNDALRDAMDDIKTQIINDRNIIDKEIKEEIW